jgi:hypothetical protein
MPYSSLTVPQQIEPSSMEASVFGLKIREAGSRQEPHDSHKLVSGIPGAIHGVFLILEILGIRVVYP